MRKLFLSALLVSPVLVQQAAAQNRNITGRVTDQANSQGLPGVTVLVKGTSIGASTNADGSYSISVPANATTLTFSSIGYLSVDRPIGTASSIDIGLSADTKQLAEVVVTALGREEQKRSLGYAIQEVQGADLTQARESNVVNSLAGKVAGVQVTNSTGASGSSSRIVIREPSPLLATTSLCLLSMVSQSTTPAFLTQVPGVASIMAMPYPILAPMTSKL